MVSEMQDIPARHGVATFVPAGSTIKIVNTSGTQVVDTWAFALPSPPSPDEKEDAEKQQQGGATETSKEDDGKSEAPQVPAADKKRKAKKGGDFPSQEEAEAATTAGMTEGEKKEASAAKKSGWSSYIPSVNLLSSKSEGEKSQVKRNSRSWGQYLSAGKGFTNYIPNKSSLSAFASSHYRDPNKPYIQQLTDFSRTPVGAAGMSVLSGQGYASSLYAGYTAWTGQAGGVPPGMEYLSMAHTRTYTTHLVPRVGDVLVSNLREPMLTLVEDTSSGVHDTLIAACDPQRYKGMGVDKWEEHGSCAENLVLALSELNERAGLKGPKGIGGDVSVNSQPPPLNLFMNIPWTDRGDLAFKSAKNKKGDYVRFRAERDVVVVMSACPNDVNGINGSEIEDGHFVVEEEAEIDDEDVKARLESATAKASSKVKEQDAQATKPAQRKTGLKKLNRPSAPAKTGSGGTGGAAQKKPAASAGHTPIGTKKAVPSSSKATPSSSSAPKANAPTPSSSSAPERPTPKTKRKTSTASTVPSNTKHAGTMSTATGSRSRSSIASSARTATGPTPQAASSGNSTAATAGQAGAAAETGEAVASAGNTGAGAATGAGPGAGQVERKKPRKIQRKTAAS